MKTRKQNGFTIVELLIVVVVIAILAAITLVTYNGIQQRAQNTQFLAAFDAYEKSLRLYKITYGDYPRAIDENGFNLYSCLGGNYPKAGMLEENECFKMRQAGSPDFVLGKKVPSVDEELKKITPQLPTANYTLVSMMSGDANVEVRGIMFQSELSPAALFYFSSGDADCGRGEKQYDPEAKLNTCRIDLP